MLTQSGAPGRVIGYTNFSYWHSVHRLHRYVLDFTLSAICILVLVGVELLLCVVVTPS